LYPIIGGLHKDTVSNIQVVRSNLEGDTVPEILTTEQLAEFVHVPVNTVHYWRAQGTGPRGIKVGKRVIYRLSDVEVWLEGKAADDPNADRRQTTTSRRAFST
jgi:predicted DNA-binding transcriptional regulator AlpA